LLAFLLYVADCFDLPNFLRVFLSYCFALSVTLCAEIGVLDSQFVMNVVTVLFIRLSTIKENVA